MPLTRRDVHEVEIPQDNQHRLTITDRYRRQYRSQSAASSDPQSPYFTHYWLQPFRKVDVCCRTAERKKGDSIPGLNLSPNDPKAATIHQHYYPEGGWGYVILCCALLFNIVVSTMHLSGGFFILEIRNHFLKGQDSIEPVLTSAASTAVSLILSPFAVALCKRKSIRLLAIFGGILTSLGCLFTSFASQLHQLYFSYGLFIASGDCLARETSAIIVGQYFKRKRSQVEMMFLMGYGLGVATMPLLLSHWLRNMGWRHGLQILAGLQSVISFIAIFYRPAALYHPQRRAILHIKSLQKRSKSKDKSSAIERHRYLDFAVLKSKTVRILIIGSGITSFGILSPFILMIEEMKKDKLDLKSMYHLQIYLGIAISVGTAAFGFIVVKNSVQCMIAKQYLCQASGFFLGVWLVAYPTLTGFYGYVLFAWIYGIFYGGYIYSLKLCVFEKVRARNYARTWGFLMCSQAIPSFIGLPLIYHLNGVWGSKRGYYVASGSLFLGSMSFFLIDFYKSKLKKKQIELSSDTTNRQLEKVIPRRKQFNKAVKDTNIPQDYGDLCKAQELTCISEEILVVENFLEDYIDDCITSCNKEEKFLMLSEYENNLFKSDETAERQSQESSDVQARYYCGKCNQCECRLKHSTEKMSSSQNQVGSLGNIDVIEEATSSL